MKTINSSIAPSESWTPEQSLQLYGVPNWSGDYFSVSPEGHLTVRLPEQDGFLKAEVDLSDLMTDLEQRFPREMPSPVLLRFPQILQDRTHFINESFRNSIARHQYKGSYRGVYPIKVNQKADAVEAILKAGRQFHHGLEVGSKAELAEALALLKDPEALLVCNGQKDHDYLDQAVLGRKLGIRVILVIESIHEARLIARRFANRPDECPLLGLRSRLITQVPGAWSKSSGRFSTFGMRVRDLMNSLSLLQENGLMGNLQMLHFHQGSQIADLQALVSSVQEAAQIYIQLYRQGADSLNILNVGGGLGVNYGSSVKLETSVRPYSVQEYCDAVVGELLAICEKEAVPPPNLTSESGRAIAAHYNCLIFPILDCEEILPGKTPDQTTNPHSEALGQLARSLTLSNLEDVLLAARAEANDALSEFRRGRLTLAELDEVESTYGALCRRIEDFHQTPENDPPNFFYRGSFSLFHSLPDLWGIDQVFPMLPLSRLHEKPEQRVQLVDLTCDSDGTVYRYDVNEGPRCYLPLHDLDPDDSTYYVGAFFLGAYQETLGDRHNLFSRPLIVDVYCDEFGVKAERHTPAETLSKVLTTVDLPEEKLIDQFRILLDEACLRKPELAGERAILEDSYIASLRNITYYLKENPHRDTTEPPS